MNSITITSVLLSLIIILSVLYPVVVFSAPAEVSARRAAGGMATEFKNYKLEPSRNPVPLPNKSLTSEDRKIIDQAEIMFDRNSSLSIVMIEKGQLVFEKYKAPATPTSLNFSWSMSKSLTAYTVGALMCEGKIPDINKPAQTYSNDLVGTVYGEATVKNLLTMSSGVREPLNAGNLIYKQPGTCNPALDCDGWTMVRARTMTNLDLIKHDPDRAASWGIPVKSGARFAYNATDTLSLANIAEHNGGFIESFNKHIWDKAGASESGAWLLDKDGKAIAQAGFSASSRDWGRMAMLTIKQLKSEDKCISNFMKEATTTQISNHGRNGGKAFSGYGYQTWVMPEKWGIPASYWWVGYGGQRVAIDPVSERILVITSSREDYMDQIYKLFNTWQQQ
jgi:CubicO group peptidase (beta-lactamase class C family)